ncbi:MAG: hypothetical protein [Circular genetic element sp.]|nr:MAG: hypothetical protein [Circular genetic element sp.]
MRGLIFIQEGVSSLASKHFSLNLSEVADVTDMLQAFESHNDVRLEVRLSVAVVGKQPTLEIVAIAHRPAWQIGEVTPLASASLKCSALNLRNLRDALIHAMYVLDSQLAYNEMNGNSEPRA